jgi:hypothetical protein
MQTDRDVGYEAGKQWVIESPPSDDQRTVLLSFLRGGQLTLSKKGWPSLVPVLGPHRTKDSPNVDFDSTPWLQGFRDALLSEFGE